MTWLVGALLALVAVLAPVPLDGPVPWYVQVPATAALAVAGGVALTHARLRTAVAVLLVGWVVLLIAVGSGPSGPWPSCRGSLFAAGPACPSLPGSGARRFLTWRQTSSGVRRWRRSSSPSRSAPTRCGQPRSS